MKRKRAYLEHKLEMPLVKKTHQSDAPHTEEYDVMNDETVEPETSMSCPSLGMFISDERTEKDVNLVHKETETRGSQADLEIVKNVHGRLGNYPNSLREIVVSIIKEMSNETGGLDNLSRSLVDNSISNGQMGQQHFDVDPGENAIPRHQDPEYNQKELNAALIVIKKTMKLDVADPFNRSVDPIALEIPTPMDFGTICNNLENGLKYANSADVFKDVQYIWFNYLKYNKKGDHILELMKRVKTFFMKYWTAAGLDAQQSATIVESCIFRHNKPEKDHSLAPHVDNVVYLQQNEAGSNQVLENEPWPINMKAEPNIDSMDIQRKRQGRGPTRCVKLLNTVGRIKVATNELGQPIGPEASQLTSFLGLTARDGNFAPLTYPTWSKVPEDNKENMWQKVVTKFDIDPCSRSWVLTSLGTKWRNFKSLLKVTYYDTHATDEERLMDRDERVLPDQWSVLVSQWSSEKWQSISAKNKANRARHRFTHTSGKKSFARIREEERAKRPDGQEPSRAELFILTRTRKNGQPVNEATAAVISQLRESTTQEEESDINKNERQDDAYTRIMGQDRKDCLSLYGLNATSSHHGTEIPSHAEALRMLTEKDVEVLQMKEKLASVEQTLSQMANQMSLMVSMMATMQKGSSSRDLPNVVAGVPYQAEPTSTSHDYEVPAKKIHGRKKKR